jgi:hypothetical protein
LFCDFGTRVFGGVHFAIHRRPGGFVGIGSGGSTVIGWFETAATLASSFALFEDIENFLSEILNGDTGLRGA